MQEHRSRAWLLCICALALGLRLATVASCLDSGLFSDMEEYQRRAIYLLHQGRLFPDAFWPPGYSIFLAGIYGTVGEQLVAVRVVQALLGTITVALTYWLARRVADRGAALAAAAIVAVYPAWLLYPVYIVSENLFTVLILAGIWLWIRSQTWAALGSGIAFGAAALSRAAGLAAIPGVIIASLANRRAMAAGILIPLLAGCGLALTPWAARNAQLYRRLILIDTNSGYNFLVGNNPRATGRLEPDDWDRIAATYWSGVSSDAERSAIGYREGLKYVRSNPLRVAALAFKKLTYLVGLEGREHAWLYSQRYFGPRSATVVWGWGLALLAAFPLLMVTATVGLLRPGLTSTHLGVGLLAILISVALLHMLSFGESRFHLPWVPLLAIAAARALDRCFAGLSPDRTGEDRSRTAEWGWPRRGALGIALLCLILTWSAQLPSLWDRLRTLASAPGLPPRFPY